MKKGWIVLKSTHPGRDIPAFLSSSHIALLHTSTKGKKEQHVTPTVAPQQILGKDIDGGGESVQPITTTTPTLQQRSSITAMSISSEFYCPFQRKVYCRNRQADYYKLLLQHGFEQDSVSGNTYSLVLARPDLLSLRLRKLHDQLRLHKKPASKNHKRRHQHPSGQPSLPTVCLTPPLSRVAVNISTMPHHAHPVPSIASQPVHHLNLLSASTPNPPRTNLHPQSVERSKLEGALMTLAQEVFRREKSHLATMSKDVVEGGGDHDTEARAKVPPPSKDAAFTTFLSSNGGILKMKESIGNFLQKGRLGELNRVRELDQRRQTAMEQTKMLQARRGGTAVGEEDSETATTTLPSSLVDALLGAPDYRQSGGDDVDSDLSRTILAAGIIRSDTRLQAPQTLLIPTTPETDTSDTPQPERSALNRQQQTVLDLAKKGYSMFIGGNAGTGKSFLLRAIIHALRHEDGLRVAVTASTGIAGLNIGGATFHSYFQVSEGSSRSASGMNAWKSTIQPSAGNRDLSKTTAGTSSAILKIAGQFKPSMLRQLDVIVIDEVSMISANLLAALSIAAKRARLSSLPFGGIQLLLSGDFMQLKCIDKEAESAEAQHQRRSTSPHFNICNVSNLKHPQAAPLSPVPSMALFRTPSFCEGVIHLKLTEVMRQASDKEFLDAINALRVGSLSPLIANSATTNPPDPDAIRLYPCRREVMEHNDHCMNALPTPWVVFPSVLDTKPLPGVFSDTATFFLGIDSPLLRSTSTALQKENAGSSSPQACLGNSVNQPNNALPLSSVHERVKSLHSMLAKEMDTAASNVFIISLGKSLRITQTNSNINSGSGNDTSLLAPPSPPQVQSQADYQFAVRVRLPPSNSHAMRAAMSSFYTQNGSSKYTTEITATNTIMPLNNMQLSTTLDRLSSRGIISDTYFHSHRVERAQMDRQSKSSVVSKCLVDIERDAATGHKQLKVGCRVMLLKNFTPTLVNGRSGVIERFSVLNFSDPAFLPIRSLYRPVRVPSSKHTTTTTTTPPLASTGGATETMTDSEMFTMVPNTRLIAHARCINIELPVVRFDDGTESYIPYIQTLLPGVGASDTGGDLPTAAAPKGSKNSFIFSISVATMPIVPAYAFTVHKVQGLTISGPTVLDCRRMWPCDHLVYVAASRVKKREHLRVVGLKEEMITVDKEALLFSSEECLDVEGAVRNLQHSLAIPSSQHKLTHPVADWVSNRILNVS